MERLKSRAQLQARLSAKLVVASTVIAVAMRNSNAVAQCSGYSVEVFAGPDCFLPSFAHATGIAETGAICGSYVDCAEVGHHVIWSPTADVTEMPASDENGIPDSPFDINSAGQVTGTMHLRSLSPPGRAFLYSSAMTMNLGTLPGHNASEGKAINEFGIACGFSRNTVSGPLSAFIWGDGQMSAPELPLGPNSIANDISDDGSICGWMGNTPDVDAHGFIWNKGTTSDCGVVPGGVSSVAMSINSSHNLCGWGIVHLNELLVVVQGFFWSKGEFRTIDALPQFAHCRPQSLNGANVVVGYCNNSPKSGLTRAFVWHDDTITALNDLIPSELNLDITHAWDINDGGQVVGMASVIGTSNRVAVRLTPIPSPIGDSDCDSDIDVEDLLGVINNWAHESPKGSNALPPCDFDHDGLVEVDDLMIVIDNWTT